MSKQLIGIGAAANDGTGDNLRAAFTKVNSNSNELYRMAQMAAGAHTCKIDAFGDSISGVGYTGIGAIIADAAQFWAPGLNVQLRDSYNVGGVVMNHINTTQLPLFQAAVAGGTPLPDIIVIQAYSNDGSITSNATADTSLGEQVNFINAVLAMGVPFVIVSSALPKAAGSNPTGRMALNAKLRYFCDNTPGAIFFDWFSDAVDPNSTSTSVSPWNPAWNGFAVDGVHPDNGAAFYAARSMAQILQNVVGRVQPRTMSNIRYANTNADTVWHNVLGAEGNYLGTSGQLNGVDNAGVAGSAATGNNRWNITTPAGVTVTPSIVTDDLGVRKQRLVFSGTPSVNGNIDLACTHNFLPTAEAIFDAQTIIDVTDMAGISAIQFGNILRVGGSFDNSAGIMPTHSGRWFIRGNIRKPVIRATTSGGLNTYTRFVVKSGVPISGSADVSRSAVFKVN